MALTSPTWCRYNKQNRLKTEMPQTTSPNVLSHNHAIFNRKRQWHHCAVWWTQKWSYTYIHAWGWLPFAFFSFRLFVTPYFLVILIHLFIIFGATLQVLLESHVWPIATQSLMIWIWCIGDKGRKNTTKRGNMCMIRLAHNKWAPKWLPKWHKAPFH